MYTYLLSKVYYMYFEGALCKSMILILYTECREYILTNRQDTLEL